GKVSVINTDAIYTTGDESHAIVAQSVGGGGGAFMMNTAKNNVDTSFDPEVAPPSTMQQLLTAVGIEKVPSASAADDTPPAKSGSFTFGGSGGVSGHGGRVTVAHEGVISTSGVAAFGILAQSIGGGGGISNSAGDPGGVKYA